MGRERRDGLPGYSCPKIDEVDKALNSAEDYCDGTNDETDPDHLAQQIADARRSLEEVRRINHELRDAAERFANEADRYEEEVNDD